LIHFYKRVFKLKYLAGGGSLAIFSHCAKEGRP